MSRAMSDGGTVFPHLGRAPIREALFDVRVRLPESVSAAQLEAAHAMVASGYPEKRTRRWLKSRVPIQRDGRVVELSAEYGVSGYAFFSADEKQVAQFRLDGFTFSRLTPYQSWETFVSEARRVWDIFHAELQPEAIIRVALRYINELVVPVSDRGWKEYLKVPPQFPVAAVERPISEFLTRYAVDDMGTHSTWLVTLSMSAAAENSKRKLLLDIDVFREASFNDAQIWETADLLRQAKNTIFFGTLSDAALELCR